MKKQFVLFLLFALALGIAAAEEFKPAGEFKCTGNPEQWLSPSETKVMLGNAAADFNLSFYLIVTCSCKWNQTFAKSKF